MRRRAARALTTFDTYALPTRLPTAEDRFDDARLSVGAENALAVTTPTSSEDAGELMHAFTDSDALTAFTLVVSRHDATAGVSTEFVSGTRLFAMFLGAIERRRVTGMRVDLEHNVPSSAHASLRAMIERRRAEVALAALADAATSAPYRRSLLASFAEWRGFHVRYPVRGGVVTATTDIFPATDDDGNELPAADAGAAASDGGDEDTSSLLVSGTELVAMALEHRKPLVVNEGSPIETRIEPDILKQ